MSSDETEINWYLYGDISKCLLYSRYRHVPKFNTKLRISAEPAAQFGSTLAISRQLLSIIQQLYTHLLHVYSYTYLCYSTIERWLLVVSSVLSFRQYCTLWSDMEWQLIWKVINSMTPQNQYNCQICLPLS